MKEWYETYFGYEMVAAFKARMERKNHLLKGNNLNKFINYRWVGLAGETSFGYFLNEIELYYEYFPSDNKPDEIDFKLGRLKIDVKTTWTNFEPRNYYECTVSMAQWERIKDGEVNCFVFCRYIVNEDRNIILGFLEKRDFERLAIFKPSGTRMGKGVTNTDCMTVRIFQLRPIIEIDRVK